MEGRTRLAIGGMSTVAASVAVICAVALTNSMSLSDSEGSTVQASRIVVPSSGAPAANDDRPPPQGVPQQRPNPMDRMPRTLRELFGL